MEKDIYFDDDLIRDLGQPADVLAKWRKLGLIHSDGTTADGISFYTRGTYKKILHVKQLIDLGYPLDDVNRIIRKIGLPPQSGDARARGIGKTSRYLTVGALADRAGVSSRTVKYWEDKGIIEPDLRSEGGFRLYPDTYVFICQLIKDLQLFGYSLDDIKSFADLFREYLVINGHSEIYSPQETEKKLENMLLSIRAMQGKLEEFKKGIGRWEDLLKKKQKEVAALLNLNKKRVPLDKKDKK